MANSPFFSIIIPTYNRADFLPKSIDSVVKQTITDWELIIIDDGSSDNTKDIVGEYSDKRISYHYQKNQERSAARNNGIEKAKGRYICFLDSDDYYLNNHLEILYEAITLHNFPIAFFFTLKKNEAIIEGPKPSNKVELVFVSNIHCQQVCIHRDILENHIFNINIEVSEDRDLWVRISENYEVFQLNHVTVCIEDHDQRTIHTSNTHGKYAHKNVIRKIINDDHNNYISNTHRKIALSNAYSNIGVSYEFAGKKLKLYKYLFISFLKYPRYRFKQKLYIAMSNCFLTRSLLRKKKEN